MENLPDHRKDKKGAWEVMGKETRKYEYIPFTEEMYNAIEEWAKNCYIACLERRAGINTTKLSSIIFWYKKTGHTSIRKDQWESVRRVLEVQGILAPSGK